MNVAGKQREIRLFGQNVLVAAHEREHVIIAAEIIEIRRGQVAGKKIRRKESDAVGGGTACDVSTRELLYRGQVKNSSSQVRIHFTRGDYQMTGCTAEIDQVFEPAEVEGTNDLRRRQLSEAMHSTEEIPGGLIATEIVIE